ncbi:MAG: hypothetical protein ACJAZT_002082 [Gammaproteobacteria bacterium]|jgi:hypothetical protein
MTFIKPIWFVSNALKRAPTFWITNSNLNKDKLTQNNHQLNLTLSTQSRLINKPTFKLRSV